MTAANTKELTPPEIVGELDRYIISQHQAKKAVAIAMRNRWRRMQADPEIQEEITPKNIIMIGPTGVGKTEISRRLAKLTGAPFVKVEASKFTEVGYVGRDVESIIRDLVGVAYHLVREEERENIREEARRSAEEQLLDVLLPESSEETSAHTRERLASMLREGKLEERVVEIETNKQVSTHLEILGPQGFGEVEGQLKDMFSNMMPKMKEQRKLTVAQAREVLMQDAEEALIDNDKASTVALTRVEQSGIVFIDEIDKICANQDGGKSPDVSREGVQRDLLPLVEGTTVSTKYGPVKTDHILFIASGAFHTAKPSDLMPEFQGRFPIRVELKSLTDEDFIRILTEPKNALTVQYQELMKTEGVGLVFTDDAISEIASLTSEVNSKTEDIGARRLHTLLERLLEELAYSAHELVGTSVTINRDYVRERLSDIVGDVDLSRFIL